MKAVTTCLFDNKSIEGDICKLMISKDYVDMDVKTFNKIKRDEIIKNFLSLITISTKKTLFKICIKCR